MSLQNTRAELAREQIKKIHYEQIKLDVPETEEFRLLRLLKGSDHPVQCELLRVPICSRGHRTRYNALSYTWGDPTQKSVVIIDGVHCEVGHNLSQALSALRRKHHDLTLWVDALCINQEDVRERNHQVRQMAKIYKNAEKVFIYLGDENHHTSLAMDVMRKAQDLNQNPAKENFTGDSRKGLQDLLGRPWFERVWVLQEAAHARSADICCGPRSVSTRVFTRALYVSGIEVEPHRDAVLSHMPETSFSGSYGSSWYLRAPLESLLKNFQHSKATDPRDKIYALLSISSDAADTELLRPDYNRTLSDVIYDTISFLIGYHMEAGDLKCFRGWDLDRLFENIFELPKLALEWALAADQAQAMVELLQHHAVRARQGQMDGDFNSRAMPWALNADYTDVVGQLLVYYDLEKKVRSLWHGAPRESLKRAVLPRNPAVAKELLRLYNIDQSFDVKKIEEAELFAARFGHMDLLRIMLSKNHKNQRIIRNINAVRAAYVKRDDAMVYLLLNHSQTTQRVDGNIFVDLLNWAVEESLNSLRHILLSRWNTLLNFRNCKEQHVVHILDQGADINLSIPEELLDSFWHTPLYFWDRRLEFRDYEKQDVVHILDHGADINLPSKLCSGYTALIMAVGCGAEKIASLLLKRGAEVDSRNSYGQTPLMRAAIKGTEVVRLLIDAGAQINLMDADGQTALFCAIKYPHLENVQLLLERGIDVNSRDRLGRTALFHAVVSGRVDSVRILLENGADFDITDSRGLTPLYYATQRGHEDVARLLTEARVESSMPARD